VYTAAGSDVGRATLGPVAPAVQSSVLQRAAETPAGDREGASLLLVRIAGIRIQVHYSWFFVFLLILWSLSAGYLPGVFPDRDPASYWIAGFVGTLCFFISILLHELAHSLVALRHGVAVPSITLFVFGGVSRLGSEVKDPLTELKIAVVGPLASFALAGLFWAARVLVLPAGEAPASLVAVVLGYLALVNAMLGFFNLLPGFPLDGGGSCCSARSRA
jgi:Zn-dependent protease